MQQTYTLKLESIHINPIENQFFINLNGWMTSSSETNIYIIAIED